MKEKYHIEDISDHQHVMEDIHKLEQKIQQEIGKEIALIAFLKDDEH